MSEPVIPERIYCPNCGNTTYGECCPEYWNVVYDLRAAEAKVAELQCELATARDTSRELNRRNGVLQKVANDHTERGAWKRYMDAIWRCYVDDSKKQAATIAALELRLSDQHATIVRDAATIERLRQECALKQQKYNDYRSESTKEYELYEAKVAEQAVQMEALGELRASHERTIMSLQLNNCEHAATIEGLTEALLKFRKQHVADLVCVEEFTNPSTPEYAPVDTRCWRCKLADAALNPQPSQPVRHKVRCDAEDYLPCSCGAQPTPSESMVQPKEKP
jgi:hypothetical protein